MQNQVSNKVVGAVIIRDGRVLLLQRRLDDTFPGLWELPSGKCEGETPEQALHREVSEETGLDVLDAREIGCFEYEIHRDEGLTVVVQRNYLVTASGGPAMHSTEHQALAWVLRSELDRHPTSNETRLTIDRAFDAPPGEV